MEVVFVPRVALLFFHPIQQQGHGKSASYGISVIALSENVFSEKVNKSIDLSLRASRTEQSAFSMRTFGIPL
ncbi:hypothetical protein C492_10785 [Natronococcus jeotgali DSM 18795]|uniref:Uncharacterized protein n=1 Tax=Natronococcus jeotgali DSM 18795 TaxID=1227498 RepID=L9XE98_9EURY|nr:hypothetical protein C492_10785 [Natronococcus jeotgali DSM 18795]